MSSGLYRTCIWSILGVGLLMLIGCNAVVIFGDGNKARQVIPDLNKIDQDTGTNKATINDLDLRF